MNGNKAMNKSAKRPTLNPSEILLPARFSLNLDALKEVRFATLDFPIQDHLTDFVEKLKNELGKGWHYDKEPPYRQLNNALMVFCPVLVHGFEKYTDKQKKVRKAVTINKLVRDPATGQIIGGDSQMPTVAAICELIETWLDRWLIDTELDSFVKTKMPSTWKIVTDALAVASNTAMWRPDIQVDELVRGLNTAESLGYDVIPAAIIALLHTQEITLEHGKQPHTIQWRKAHNGFKDGLHLVSQPIFKTSVHEDSFGNEKDPVDGYFVYQLWIEVETQSGRIDSSGRLNPWIFIKTGMRRYADEPLRDDAIRRDQTVLVALHRERMPFETQEKLKPLPYDSTLIALPIEREFKGSGKNWTMTAKWAGRLSGLLDDYAVIDLSDADSVLESPAQHGNLSNSTAYDNHEHYLIHAEGRKYGEKGRGKGHSVNTGFSLKENTEIVQRVLEAIPGVLIQDDPFVPDISEPKKYYVPAALKTFEDIKGSKAKDKPDIIREAVARAIRSATSTGLDIAIVHQNDDFLQAVEQKIREVLSDTVGTAEDETPLIRIHDARQSPELFALLNSGDLTDEDRRGKRDAWNDQIAKSRHAKVEAWEAAMNNIAWRPGTHRMALIESYYAVKGNKEAHEEMHIKGAVRQACSNAKVASQFIAHFKKQQNGKLSTTNGGKVQNAVLDLVFRQNGLLYGTPGELYDKAAELLPMEVPNLDVVAFYHVQKNTTLNRRNSDMTMVIAVRLCADGSVQVMWPKQTTWIPYAQAVHTLGAVFAENRSNLKSHKAYSALLLENKVIMEFVHEVLTKHLNAPTVAVVQARWWRNSGSKEHPGRWSQLGNTQLINTHGELRLGGKTIKRDEPDVKHLLAVIRLRMGDETPQYTTGTQVWDASQQRGDLNDLSGYIDRTVPQLMHYFSVGRLASFQEKQTEGEFQDGYKEDLYGDFAYKHAQLVELVPFFVHPDFNTDEHKKILCRCIHFLRVSPAFVQANLLLPYPMHLAKSLLEDLLCIVDAE